MYVAIRDSASSPNVQPRATAFVDDDLGSHLASNEVKPHYHATEKEKVNTEIFAVIRAPTAEAKKEAKITLLKNCKHLRIHSILSCPEFLDFLIDTYTIPGLRVSSLLGDVRWLQTRFFPSGHKDTKPSIVTGVRAIIQLSHNCLILTPFV
jgi:hypothetical protein